IFRLQTKLGAGQSDFGQSGADRRLAGDEGGAAGGATLLAVPICKQRAFFGDAIDVGRAIPHDAMVVSADLKPSDVVSPDDEDFRLLLHLSNFLCHEGALLCFLADDLSKSLPSRCGCAWILRT